MIKQDTNGMYYNAPDPDDEQEQDLPLPFNEPTVSHVVLPKNKGGRPRRK